MMTQKWTYGWYDESSALKRGEAPVGSYDAAVSAVRQAVGYTDPEAKATIARPGKMLIWANSIVVGIVESKRVEMAEAV